MKMTADVKQILAQLHNSLMNVQSSGESGILISNCIVALRQLVNQAEVIASEQSNELDEEKPHKESEGE